MLKDQKCYRFEDAQLALVVAKILLFGCSNGRQFFCVSATLVKVMDNPV